MSRRIFLTALICFWAAACAQLDIKEPVTKFQAATATATTTIGSYYQELNAYERNLYLLDRLVDPSKMVSLREHGKETPLLGKPFGQNAIDVRLALFKQIADYAASLGLGLARFPPPMLSVPASFHFVGKLLCAEA